MVAFTAPVTDGTGSGGPIFEAGGPEKALFLNIEDVGYYLSGPMQGLQTLPCLKDEKFDARLDWYEGVCKDGVVRGEKC